MSRAIRWHLGQLDALRGIAVLGVVAVHAAFGASGDLPLPQAFAKVIFLGQRGVQLFFVVSAFTLFLSVQNRKDELHPTRNFFLRRFFRLAPMFYLATLLTCFLLPTYAGSLKQVAITLTFLHGLSPETILKGAAGGWSVADEALFYLVLPLLFRWIRSLRAAGVWLMVSAPCSLLLAHWLEHRDPARGEYYDFFSFLAQFPVFLCGIVAFFIWKDYFPKSDDNQRTRNVFPVLLFALLAVAYITLPSVNNKLIGTTVLATGLLLLLSLHPSPLLVNPVTRFLGKTSYSIYLVHFFFMDLLWKVRTPSLFGPAPKASLAIFGLHFFGTLALTLPIALLSWRFIEEPGIRLGRRLIDRLEHRAATRRQALVPPAAAATQAGNSPDAQF